MIDRYVDFLEICYFKTKKKKSQLAQGGGGGVKALIARPLREYFFLRLPLLKVRKLNMVSAFLSFKQNGSLYIYPHSTD